MERIQKEVQKLINLFKLKKINEAELLNKKLIENYPQNVFLYNLMGLIKIDQSRLDDAINYLKKGTEIKSDYAPLYDNLGTAYKYKKKYDEAESYYKKSISLDNNAPEAQNNLGNLYSTINKSYEAIKCYKNAIKINSNFYSSHYNLGIIYKSLGMFDEAIIHLKKSIELNTFLYSAHRSLSALVKYSRKNDHYNTLKKLYKSENIKSKNSELMFALAKASEDIKDYDKAFDYYKEGNDLRRKQISFSINEEQENFQNIKKIFNKKLFKKYKNSGYSDNKAIFIVGMPRSGTTLIEQILSSHPKVFGGDELNFLPDLVKKHIDNRANNISLKNINNFNFEEFKKMGENYIDNLRNISNDMDRITDKLPINFKWIGLIKLILPNSKIVHCIRNPKDNCFSIFKNYFPNPNLNFAYDLEEITSFYNIYINLMKHWKKTLPGFIIDIKYERMVSDSDSQIRSLVKRCDLTWDKKCLKFYNNRRIIKTTSDTQARKKIYGSSINSWKKYRKQLNSIFKKIP